MLSEHSHLGSIVGTTLPFNRGLVCKAEELSAWVGTVKKGNPPPIQGGLASGSILGTSVDNPPYPPIHGSLPSEIASGPSVDGGRWQRGEGGGFFGLF